MRRTSLASLALCVAALGFAGWAFAQSDGAGSTGKRPLDLPSGGNGEEEDEEDIPEQIHYYGTEIEGDGFFWCLDRSCSMGDSGEFEILKAETVQAIQQLSLRTEFAVVFYSSNLTVWPMSEMPARATPSNKSAATAWVQTTPYQGTTCMTSGAVKTIEIANRSDKRRRQILMLGDGEPYCPGSGDSASSVLSEIATANYERVVINTFYISEDSGGVQLFQDIAAQNGGTFTLVY
jgi:hypothetical protein